MCNGTLHQCHEGEPVAIVDEAVVDPHRPGQDAMRRRFVIEMEFIAAIADGADSFGDFDRPARPARAEPSTGVR